MAKRKTFWSSPWTQIILGGLVVLIIWDIISKEAIIGTGWNFLKGIFGFINETYSVPFWLLVGLFIGGLLTLPVLGHLFNGERKQNQIQEPAWMPYRSDYMNGVLIKWDYRLFSRDVEILNIVTYCPTHNARLIDYHHCPVCHKQFPFVDGKRARALIQYKIDNNLWTVPPDPSKPLA